MKIVLNVLGAIAIFILVFLGGVALGVMAEQKRPKPPPEPVIHHHLYYLDRSECKKPV